MVANIVKIKECLVAVGTFLKNVLTLRFPLWLYIVAFSAAALFALCVSCSHSSVLLRQCAVGSTEYHGHSYLVFTRFGSSVDGAIDVIHDPECICFIDSIGYYE